MNKQGRKKKDILSDEFKDSAKAMQTEELKEKIIFFSKQEKEIIEQKDKDEKLKEISSVYADLNGSYKDALKYNKAQRQFLLSVLEERG